MTPKPLITMDDLTVTTERPKYLFKYVSADAGLAILQSQQLCWSSPNCYESPFEMNGKCSLPFTSDELLDSTVKLSITLIFNTDKPKGDTSLMAAINRWRDEERFDSPQQAEAVLKELLQRMVTHKEEQLHETLQKWQMFVESVRSCCFCAKGDIATAWEKYADNHRGFAVAIAPDSDNGLELAQPIKYSNERPFISTLKEQINELLYKAAANPSQNFPKHLLAKPDFLANELEWRTISPKNESFSPTQDPNRDLKSLSAGSIKAIYLGLNCSEKDRESAIAAAKLINPAPKVLQATLGKTSYKLEFQTAGKSS